MLSSLTATSSYENAQMDIIPANTQLQSTLYSDPEDSHVTLLITTTNNYYFYLLLFIIMLLLL